MGRKHNCRLALLALGVLVLSPAGLPRAAADPGPADPAPHYSSWAYRMPLLYRLHECLHYHEYGHTPDCYPTEPTSYLIIKCPVYIFDPNTAPHLPAPGSADAGVRSESP
jgi:hypothetical protein